MCFPRSNDANGIALALINVLFAYQGWNNVNNVANEMRNPLRTVKTAGPTALGIVFFLYIFANSESQLVFTVVPRPYSDLIPQLRTSPLFPSRKPSRVVNCSRPSSSLPFSAITPALAFSPSLSLSLPSVTSSPSLLARLGCSARSLARASFPLPASSPAPSPLVPLPHPCCSSSSLRASSSSGHVCVSCSLFVDLQR